MDFIVELPKSKHGFDAITVFVDRLSKMAHFVPCHTASSAPQIAELFMSHVFRAHGLPSSIISDRDPRFTGHFWKALWKTLGTSLDMSTAFHPQTDGQTEQMNRTLEEMLRAFVNYRQDNWDTCLLTLEFAYNNSKHASTEHTPFFLNYGHHPRTPATLLTPMNTPAADDFALQIQNLTKAAQDALALAQANQEQYANVN